jgi:lysophospholipase L1-like esterase
VSGRAVLATCALLVALAPPAGAQTVSGKVFHDLNANGILDAGEPVLQGFDVQLYGDASAGGAFDQTVPSAADGSYTFSPGDGCYLVRPIDPPGWRMSVTRSDGFPESTPGYTSPVGQPRFGKLDGGIDNLAGGSLRYTSMGDSIAWNWNSCFFQESFWYSKQVRSRMACAAPGASITLDEAAVKGEHTDDLLVDDSDDLNNVFRVMEIQPDLITLSMIGNDLLDVDAGNNPTQQETNTAVEEVLDARQNLQEAVSVMLSETPADVTLNTLYDNETYNCDTVATTDFHRDWLPIISRMLRELAWGQVRRVSINEARAEFAAEDLQGGCTGFEGRICRDIFQTDLIHPNNSGYELMREKVWEGVGGLILGSGDVLGRGSFADVDYGYLQHLTRLLPTTWETRDGASASTPEAALDDQDGGAAASITLGIGTEEFRLAGFPDWLDEYRIVKVIAGVRYSTSGTVNDDFYRMEASVTGQFRPPPGHDYTTTNWNFYTPIVGGGGPNRPALNPDYGNAKLLALPNVATPREVSATLTKNPTLQGGAAGYEWPALTHADLATTAIRIAAAPVAGTSGNDGYQVLLDAVWLDLYGEERARPQEVSGLQVDRLVDGSLEVSFDELPGAQRYNLYFGRLGALPAYDHGASAPAGPQCAAATAAAGPGRLKITVAPGDQPADDSYIVVTAHVDDVESPAGFATGAVEIDRSQSTCR